jgi:hypothetical protein
MKWKLKHNCSLVSYRLKNLLSLKQAFRLQAQELFDLPLQSAGYALGQDLARGQRVKA